MDFFNSLPLEITSEILSRVPTESVLECKLVCTTWNNLVSHHPSFSKMHFYHLNHPYVADDGKSSFFASTTKNNVFWYLEYNENHESTNPIQRIKKVNLTYPFRVTKFAGSCNGLVCLLDYFDPCFCICNPITREYVMLSNPVIKRDWSDNIEGYNWERSSFSYVSSTNEYKVVAMHVSKTHVELHIYTLGSGTGWRNLGKFNFQFSIHTWNVAGIFANEALYWLDDELGTIITFDLAEEKFCEHLSPPPLPQYDDWWGSRIGVLDGFLYFAVSLGVKHAICHDVWLLKKKNIDNHEMKELEEHQSLVWSKEFKVGNGRLLTVTKTGGVLTYNTSCINIYDTKSSTSKRLVEFNNWRLQVSPHQNTLISLKELGEENTKTMESVELEDEDTHDYLQEDENPDYIIYF